MARGARARPRGAGARRGAGRRGRGQRRRHRRTRRQRSDRRQRSHRARRDRRAARGGMRARQLPASRLRSVRDDRALRDVRGRDHARAHSPAGFRRARPEDRRVRQRGRSLRRASAQSSHDGHRGRRGGRLRRAAVGFFRVRAGRTRADEGRRSYGIGLYAPAGFALEPEAIIARDDAVRGARPPRHRRSDGIDALAAVFGARRRAAGRRHAHGVGSARSIWRSPCAAATAGRGCSTGSISMRSPRRRRAGSGTAISPHSSSRRGRTPGSSASPVRWPPTISARNQPSSFTIDHCWALLGNASYEIELPLDGPADFAARGTLWGGNLAMVAHLVGTPHFPAIDGGILVLEDVGEQPYRVERMLYQLHFAGVLGRQRALLLGSFNGFEASPNDNGYDLAAMIAHARATLRRADLYRVAVRPLPRQADLALRRALPSSTSPAASPGFGCPATALRRGSARFARAQPARIAPRNSNATSPVASPAGVEAALDKARAAVAARSAAASSSACRTPALTMNGDESRRSHCGGNAGRGQRGIARRARDRRGARRPPRSTDRRRRAMPPGAPCCAAASAKAYRAGDSTSRGCRRRARARRWRDWTRKPRRSPSPTSRLKP